MIEWVRALGHETFDLARATKTRPTTPISRAVAEAVAKKNADVGIVIDGAGIGSAMAANQVHVVRATNCWDGASSRF